MIVQISNALDSNFSEEILLGFLFGIVEWHKDFNSSRFRWSGQPHETGMIFKLQQKKKLTKFW